MEGHVRTLGYLYIAFAVLFLLLAGLCFVAILGGGLLSGDRDAAMITGGVATMVGGIFAIFAIPALITGFGLLKFRQWARVLAIILGVLNILNFPFGTALGIYTLWVLLNQQAQPLFT